jgi:hypothetical protein
MLRDVRCSLTWTLLLWWRWHWEEKEIWIITHNWMSWFFVVIDCYTYIRIEIMNQPTFCSSFSVTGTIYIIVQEQQIVSFWSAFLIRGVLSAAVRGVMGFTLWLAPLLLLGEKDDCSSSVSFASIAKSDEAHEGFSRSQTMTSATTELISPLGSASIHAYLAWSRFFRAIRSFVYDQSQ